MSKKIVIFLSDGVGLRNFAFNSFYKLGQKLDFDITYYNTTSFHLNKEFGYQEQKIDFAKVHWFSDILKRAKKEIELKLSYKKTKNKAYLSYLFSNNNNSFKKIIKNILVKLLIFLCTSQKGLKFIRIQLQKQERKTEYFTKIKEQLLKQRPSFIFFTSQRTLTAVSPILAAKDLQIPTATFIFSWDNLPKGMMFVETDYYFVWSDFMKEELQQYYPYIKENQIIVVGTPQFDVHFKTNSQSLNTFIKEYKLDNAKEYICYSGDDITTSPNDPFYLQDIAQAVRLLNKKSDKKIGIIFRRCPVDFSKRYDFVLQEYKEEITSINPLWKTFGENWNDIMPTPQDTEQLINTLKISKAVINLGSTMLFDAACHSKPCAYVNYTTETTINSSWDIKTIYKYIHFQSMPNKDAVVWISSKKDIETVLKTLLNNPQKYVLNAKKWLDKINKPPHSNATETIWNSINQIVNE